MKNLSLHQKFQHYASLTLKRHREGNRSFALQSFQMLVLALVAGHGPGFYHMAGFWRRSVTWREMLGHPSASKYRQRIRKLNPDAYRKLSQNKLAEKGILTLLGFPVTRFIGFYHPLYGRSCTGQPLTDRNGLVNLIESLNCSNICFKPLEGWAGKGFHAVRVDTDNGQYRFRSRGQTTKPITIEDLLAGWAESGVIIEEYLDQHPTLASFNPSSVNTYRIWVAEQTGRPAVSLFGYLRIGREGSLVDNQSNGGIVAPIDLETGITGSAIDGLATRNTFSTHPDHGAVIEGQQLPFWKEAKALSEACLGAFPKLRFAGLDIAVREAGPAIVEMNVSPDREGAAFVDVPASYVMPLN